MELRIRDTTETTIERGMLAELQQTAAWREMEADREKKRRARHRELAKERVELLKERDAELGKLTMAHQKAMAAAEKAADALRDAEIKLEDARLARSTAATSYDGRDNRLRVELRQTADRRIAELRRWAREEFDAVLAGREGGLGTKETKTARGYILTPRTEEWGRASKYLRDEIMSTDSGATFDAEMSDLTGDKLAVRLAEIKAHAQELLDAARARPEPVGKVEQIKRKVLDAAAQRAARKERNDASNARLIDPMPEGVA